MPFRVSRTQLHALDRSSESLFTRRVADYLKANHPEAIVRLPTSDHTVETLPEEELLRLVEAALSAARGYGLTWESSLNGFATLMFTVAPNFHQYPAIAAVLENDLRLPDERIGDLPGAITIAEWEEAAEAYDPNAWGTAGHHHG